MPLVKIHYKSRAIEVNTLKLAVPQIRESIAKALNCSDEGGQLTASDMEISFFAVGMHDESDFDVLVDIEAMNFPKRKKNKNERAYHILDTLRGLLTNDLEIAVWLKLVNAAWVTDNPDLR